MWILEPISIATQGYVAVTPTNDRCPQPLAIASHGYITFEAGLEDPFGGGMGHGAIIQERYPEPPKKNLAKLALLAVIAIEQTDD